jgi:mannose-1-phosphate guanylyltransferase
VDDVVLSCGFMGDDVERVLGSRHGGMRLRYVNETTPLGTAGPVRLALDEGALTGDRLLVLNGDVLTDMDLTAELRQHEVTGAAATLALIEVEDTSSYGVVPTAPDGQVHAFLEKAGEGAGPPPTNRINAGAYVLERSVIESIPSGAAVSFERETFPALVGAGLYGWNASGYWIDIGTPERYLESTYDLLEGRVASTLPPRDAGGSLVWPGARVEGATIGPLTVVSEDCEIAPGAVVERAALHRGVRVAGAAHIDGAVLGEDVAVGEGARIEPGAVIGAGAVIEAGAVVGRDARCAPAERVA